MKIGIISQWYEPEGGAAAHPTAIARALRSRGHQIRVLTAFPSYPTGKVHSGYRMRYRLFEHVDGIDILRVPDVPSHDESAVRRALSLASFAGSAATQVGWLREADVCLTYLTPATVGAAAWTLRRRWRVPYVLYVQDLWPETVLASGFIGSPWASSAATSIMQPALRKLYRDSDGIAAISPSMASALATRGAKIAPEFIPNWIDEDLFAPAVPRRQRELPEDRSWVMYAGSVGQVQALQHSVRAISLLEDRPDIGLAIVGEGVALASLKRMVGQLGVADRVQFLENRPMTQMPALMSEAIAQLVSLADLPLFRGTLPSKLQASMAIGSPVLNVVGGDAAGLVARTGAGVNAPPEDPAGIAAAIRTLVDMSVADRNAMGRRGRRAYQLEMSSKVGSEALERMLARAARGQR